MQITKSQRAAETAERERSRFRKRAAEALREAFKGKGPQESEPDEPAHKPVKETGT